MFCIIFLLGQIELVTELMARLTKFRTINIQTITLTCATPAAYASHCSTAPCNQLMAQRQMLWNPTAFFRITLRRALGVMRVVLDLVLYSRTLFNHSLSQDIA